jgi:AraC-like DNA-binding protein
VVRPVHQDARGIVAPAAGLRRFRLDRHAPSTPVARFVDRYWLVHWDLPVGETYDQQVLPHPVVNLVLSDGGASVNGPATRLGTRRLTGQGAAVGVMFRPGGFHPLLGRPLSAIADDRAPATAWLADRRTGDALAALATDLAAGRDADEVAGAVDAVLAAVLPTERQPCEDTITIAERVAAEPGLSSVEALAAAVGWSVRQVQRRFAEHVGLSPKAVIRRYRLFEAAERARHDEPVDWAALAGDLGYSDQSHLGREFRRAFGVPPAAYARQLEAANRRDA